MSNLIQLSNINKSFLSLKRINVLKKISYKFKSGKIYSLMGPSGSGKSTLLNLLSLIDRPSSGSIVIDNKKIDPNNSQKNDLLRANKIGIIYQQDNLLADFTALENVYLANLTIEKNKEFNPPIECKFKLSGNQVRQKMQKKLDELYNNKKILDHGMVVGKELAYVLSGGDTEKNKEISEDQMYNLELNSFMKLLETQNTQNRIVHTLKTGKPLIN